MATGALWMEKKIKKKKNNTKKSTDSDNEKNPKLLEHVDAFPDTDRVNVAMRIFTDLYCLEQAENRIQKKGKRRKKGNKKRGKKEYR